MPAFGGEYAKTRLFRRLPPARGGRAGEFRRHRRAHSASGPSRRAGRGLDRFIAGFDFLRPKHRWRRHQPTLRTTGGIGLVYTRHGLSGNRLGGRAVRSGRGRSS
jgi:hypothetical protein